MALVVNTSTTTLALPEAAIPTPEDVHALIATRPVFTSTSRPALVDVERLIANKAAEVDMRVPADFDLSNDLIGHVKATITFGAAADIEASYMPEQQFGENARAAVLAATYLRMLLDLTNEITRLTAPERRFAFGSIRLGSPFGSP